MTTDFFVVVSESLSEVVNNVRLGIGRRSIFNVNLHSHSHRAPKHVLQQTPDVSTVTLSHNLTSHVLSQCTPDVWTVFKLSQTSTAAWSFKTDRYTCCYPFNMGVGLATAFSFAPPTRQPWEDLDVGAHVSYCRAQPYVLERHVHVLR